MITRDVSRASAQSYDLIAVGGGIYGVMLTMEAARRGLRPLLLERADFGGATSWSSLRIVHGGLRYLQRLDLSRFRESVSERSWFCRTYPDLVEPLECVMPLYGNGLKRPSTFRVALWFNDALSRNRNARVPDERSLPSGRVIDAAATRRMFPMVDADGLRGGGVWYDAAMTSSVRLLMETLRWACRNGATALNYVECSRLLADHGGVSGVEALDHAGKKTAHFHAPVVVNCAGSSSASLAAKLGYEHESLFRPSLAFNLLLRREPLSEAALAVTPGAPGARTYFLRPWRGRIFAGTFHAPCEGHPSPPIPGAAQIQRFLTDLNDAVPGLELTGDDIVRVYSGLLPARRRGSEELAVRPKVVDHSTIGGPKGLWSVSGVKYTTARLVAEQTLRGCFRTDGRDLGIRPGTERPDPVMSAEQTLPTPATDGGLQDREHLVRTIVEEEAVIFMDDLLLRRTDWGTDPTGLDRAAETVTELLGRRLPTSPEHARLHARPAVGP